MESDIVIAGRADPVTGTLSLGTVSGKTGQRVRLSLMVHGERHCRRLKRDLRATLAVDH